MRNAARCLAALALCALVAPGAAAADELDAERRALIADIDALARDTARETGRPAFDARVMAAMAKVERHRFVHDRDRRAAREGSGGAAARARVFARSHARR